MVIALRVSRLSFFEAAPAPAIFLLEPAPALGLRTYRYFFLLLTKLLKLL